MDIPALDTTPLPVADRPIVPPDPAKPSAVTLPPPPPPEQRRNAIRSIPLTLAADTPTPLSGDFKGFRVLSAGDDAVLKASVDGGTFAPLQVGDALITTGAKGSPLWIMSAGVGQLVEIEYVMGELSLIDNRGIADSASVAGTIAGEVLTVAATANQVIATQTLRSNNAVMQFALRIKATVAGAFTVKLRNTTDVADIFTMQQTLAIGEIVILTIPFALNTGLQIGKVVSLVVSTDATAAGLATGVFQQVPV